MQLSFATLFFLTGASSAAAITACNADNCLRALKATNFPNRAVTADCQAFQTTSTTITSFVTLPTVTTTKVIYPGQVVDKRGVGLEKRAPPASIASYATSACKNAAQYASACSCVSVTSSLLILGTTTSTVTPTSTVTSTACSTFKLRATDGPNAGQFFNAYPVYFGQEQNAFTFVYRNGEFRSPDNGIRLRSSIRDDHLLYIDQFESSAYTLSCTIDANGGVSCTNSRGTLFSYCSGTSYVTFSDAAFITQRQCTAFTPQYVPQC